MQIRCTLFLADRKLAERSVFRLQRRLADEFPEGAELKVVDVDQDPALASRRDILLLPTLIRHEPKPETRFVGDLDDLDALVELLKKRIAPTAAAQNSKPSD